MKNVTVPAGELRHYITIEQPVKTRTSTGATNITWQTFAANVPAAIVYGGGLRSAREQFIDSQEQAYAYIEVTLRYLAGLNATMRVNYNGAIYNIASVQPDPTQRSYFTLICVQGLNLG